MKKFYEEFIKILEKENKEQAYEYCLQLIENEQIDLISLYENILTPALNSMDGDFKNDKQFIWKEHVRSAIIRSIIEALSISFVNMTRDKRGYQAIQSKVVVVCPTEEYHEIGARIVSDLFSIAGFDSIFIGANTPNENIISAIEVTKPDYLAVSVTNYYHLVSAKKLIDIIKAKFNDVKIIVGGQALLLKDASELLQVDYRIQNFDEILNLAKEVQPWD